MERFRRALFDGQVKTLPSLGLRSACSEAITLGTLASSQAANRVRWGLIIPPPQPGLPSRRRARCPSIKLRVPVGGESRAFPITRTGLPLEACPRAARGKAP